MRLRPLVLPILVAGLVLAACGEEAGDSTTSAAVATTAADTTAVNDTTGADGSLVLYSGRNENFVEPVVTAFTEETGIEVEVRYAGTSDLAATIVAEGAASPADVFWAQDPAFIGGLANQGLLAELPEDVLAKVDDEYVDGNGRWVGITARSRVLVYNTDLVAEDELPATIWDLAEPAWSDRLGMAPTNGSFVAFVTGMVLTEGEERTREWLESVAANDPVVFDGNGPIVEAVVAGDVDAGLVNHYYLLQQIAEVGAVPAANHYFADGDPGGLVMATGAGVLASSDQPEAALELVTYLLSETSQTHFLELFEYPLVDGIGTPAGQVPLEELPNLGIDLSDTADTLDPALSLIAEAGLS